MFENGCFLRRQRRFRCPRKEIARRRDGRTTSTNGAGSRSVEDEETVKGELPPAEHSATSIEHSGDRKSIVQSERDPFPPPAGDGGRDVSLLQAMAPAADYTAFPLTYSSGGGLYAAQPCYLDDRYPYYGNLALQLQRRHHHHQPHQQPHLASSSPNPRYPMPSPPPPPTTTLGPPEVLTSTFPVHDALQRHYASDAASLLPAALNFRSQSQPFQTPAKVHSQLWQPPYHHHHPSVVSDVDLVPTVVGASSVPSFGPYQFRFDDHQRRYFRSPSSSSSGSGRPTCGGQQRPVLHCSPEMSDDATASFPYRNLLSLQSSPAMNSVDSCRVSSVHPVLQRLQSTGSQL